MGGVSFAPFRARSCFALATQGLRPGLHSWRGFAARLYVEQALRRAVCGDYGVSQIAGAVSIQDDVDTFHELPRGSR